MDIEAHSGIIQAYSEPCVTMAYSKPEAYPELWDILKQKQIQNPGLFRTGGILRTFSNICFEAL